MEFINIFLMALLVSGLTLYSGFGLGTLLLPAYALYFSPEVAVIATAVVHFANNIFKVSLVGKKADKNLVLRFGLPAIVAAFVGASLLGYVSHLGEIIRYELAGQEAIITPLKLIIAIFMMFFALVELLPRCKTWKFDSKYLMLGGILSGFFGGFSGHQGALRSAFLAKVSLEPAVFVGSNAVIGFLVDMARLLVYGLYGLGITLSSEALFGEAPSAGACGGALGGASPENSHMGYLVLMGMAGAFMGVILGKKYLHKLTISMVQNITGCMLLGIALALGVGIL